MAVYLKPEDLYFELMICKGKGKASDKLSSYFYLIADNLKNKPPFSHTPDFSDDGTMEAYTMMMESWMLVELEKFEPNQIFAYFTERGKRSYTKIFNTYMDRSPQRWDDFSKLSLTNLINF